MEELAECPVCHEDCGFIETEGGWCLYAQCGNCGTHTAHTVYENEEQRQEAELKVIRLWNMGKVIAERRGE